MSVLRVRTFAVVTGASRGLGRMIAVQLAREIKPGSVIYITARTLGGLEETASIIKQNVNENLDVRCVAADLSDAKEVDQLKKLLFENVGDTSRFEHAILIHNAASLGAIGKFSSELDDVELIQKNCLLNVTAPITLTSFFLKTFKSCKRNLRKTVVQITAVSGINPRKTFHLYGTVKAGRDMFFRVMALEEPEVRILAYDPGFVATEMFNTLQESKDSSLRATAKYIAEQSFFLSPEKSAHALMKALEEDRYESGSVVRCYDVMNIDVSEMDRQLQSK